jgi:hypothetical protein
MRYDTKHGESLLLYDINERIGIGKRSLAGLPEKERRFIPISLYLFPLSTDDWTESEGRWISHSTQRIENIVRRLGLGFQDLGSIFLLPSIKEVEVETKSKSLHHHTHSPLVAENSRDTPDQHTTPLLVNPNSTV